MAAALPLYKDALISFESEPFEIDKQTARLALQIHKGINPSELPVEAEEVFLAINIATAEKIGITLNSDVLVQANKIIRYISCFYDDGEHIDMYRRNGRSHTHNRLGGL